MTEFRGAIDIGSNAMRMAIGSFGPDGKLSVLDSDREPVGLGRSVFKSGVISDETSERAIATLTRFKKLLDKHGVESFRAVGTSALREAQNSAEFLAAVNKATGINIDVIEGEEEARLISLSVADRVDLGEKEALLLDIGGGSVELTLISDGGIVYCESFKMGAVRLLNRVGAKTQNQTAFARLVARHLKGFLSEVEKELSSQPKIEIFVGTGGNVEALGVLKTSVLGEKDPGYLPRESLQKLIEHLEGLTIEERIAHLNLRADRADVILPAAIILAEVMKQSKTREVLIPNVGLKEGVLIDLLKKSEIAAATESTVSKFCEGLNRYPHPFDAGQGRITAGFALQIFDVTQDVHGLEREDRIILLAAALLHKIGRCRGEKGHHKHSYDLIRSFPFGVIGIDRKTRELIANVARYHRKAHPTPKHEPFAALSDAEKIRVTKLAAILRLAVALVSEDDAVVSSFHIVKIPGGVSLAIRGLGDLFEAIQSSELMQKGDLFIKTICPIAELTIEKERKS